MTNNNKDYVESLFLYWSFVVLVCSLLWLLTKKNKKCLFWFAEFCSSADFTVLMSFLQVQKHPAELTLHPEKSMQASWGGKRSGCCVLLSVVLKPTSSPPCNHSYSCCIHIVPAVVMHHHLQRSLTFMAAYGSTCNMIISKCLKPIC